MKTAAERVREMYSNGASNEQVAEWLFGPQWHMAATPKDGWSMATGRWAPASTQVKQFSELFEARPDGLYYLNIPGYPPEGSTSIVRLRLKYSRYLRGLALDQDTIRQLELNADLFELDFTLSGLVPPTLPSGSVAP